MFCHILFLKGMMYRVLAYCAAKCIGADLAVAVLAILAVVAGGDCGVAAAAFAAAAAHLHTCNLELRKRQVGERYLDESGIPLSAAASDHPSVLILLSRFATLRNQFRGQLGHML
eukprot:s2261_g5.t1